MSDADNQGRVPARGPMGTEDPWQTNLCQSRGYRLDLIQLGHELKAKSELDELLDTFPTTKETVDVN